jgi:hypothetical protein
MHLLAALTLIALPLGLTYGQSEQAQSGQSTSTAENVIGNWPEEARSAARNMMEKYGQPDGVTESRLIWNDAEQWSEIIVYRDEIQHNFPMPHKDVLEQTIPYNVPADKFDELAEYDGSVIVDKTKGTMSARCDREAANILALNLADDIIKDRRSVEEAREYYSQAIARFASEGRMDPYMQQLRFSVAQSTDTTGDPDVAVIETEGQPGS